MKIDAIRLQGLVEQLAAIAKHYIAVWVREMRRLRIRYQLHSIVQRDKAVELRLNLERGQLAVVEDEATRRLEENKRRRQSLMRRLADLDAEALL